MVYTGYDNCWGGGRAVIYRLGFNICLSKTKTNTKTLRFKTKTDTKTCKNGSRDVSRTRLKSRELQVWLYTRLKVVFYPIVVLQELDPLLGRLHPDYTPSPVEHADGYLFYTSSQKKMHKAYVRKKQFYQ